MLSLPEGLLRRRHWRHRRRGLRHLQVPHGRPRGKEPRLLYSSNDFLFSILLELDKHELLSRTTSARHAPPWRTPRSPRASSTSTPSPPTSTCATPAPGDTPDRTARGKEVNRKTDKFSFFVPAEIPRCANGYYGNPLKVGDTCKPCDCSGNANPYAPNWCDHRTGECLQVSVTCPLKHVQLPLSFPLKDL